MSRGGLFLLIFVLTLGGCAAPPRAQFPDARSAIDQLRESTECSRALQGEAKLEFSGEGRRLRGKILYAVHAPGSIRFDVFSPFGVTLSTLTSDGERFGLYNLEERSFIYGASSTCNVERFTQVPVPPMVLVELLRGRPPVLAHQNDAASIAFRRRPLSRGNYVVSVEGAHQARQELEIGVVPQDWDRPVDDQRLRLLGVKVEQAGELLYEVDLSRHRVVSRAEIEPDPEALEMGITPASPTGPECSAEVPGKIRFYVPESGHELTFDSIEQFHNPPLGSGTFVQPVPAGVVARESRCID